MHFDVDLSLFDSRGCRLRNSESPLPIPQTPSTFHLHAQRSVDRRDVRQQRRLFARQNLTPRPQVQAALLRLSAREIW
jgi:hypothetical protein